MKIPILFNPTEVASILGISRTSVYNLMRDGSLKSLKIRGSRKISKGQILAFINASQRETYI